MTALRASKTVRTTSDQKAKDDRVKYNELYSGLITEIGQNHDKDAYKRVFKEFYPRVKSYLASLGIDHEKLDDIAQDVMTTIWRKAHQYDVSKAAPVTWIFTIARNRYIDACIRKKNHNFTEQDASYFMVEFEDPDVSYSRLNNQEIIQDMLKKLPETQLELVKMAYFKDYSHREISEIMGWPLGTVKSRLRVALQKMKKLLGHNIL
ncbi:MAG: sigma-70 family RNA polymerase sigma factor [Pseudomonadota bacterium]